MKQFFVKAAMFTLALMTAGDGIAAFQTTPVIINGNISDINATGQQNQTVAGSFGSNNEAINLRLSNDSTNLYVGISAHLEGLGSPGTRGIWVILDSKPGGDNTLLTNAIPFAPGGSIGLDGIVLEPGFNADYIYFMQNGDSGNRQNYFLNTQDLQADSDAYYGVFDVTAGSFNPSGGSAPAGFSADVDNSEAAVVPGGAAAATKGLEFQIPLAAIGATASSMESVVIMVGMGDGGNGYFSNQTLPASNSTTNLGGGGTNSPKVNFATNSYGAFGGSTGDGFSGSQGYVMTLPVSLSSFTLE